MQSPPKDFQKISLALKNINFLVEKVENM